MRRTWITLLLLAASTSPAFAQAGDSATINIEYRNRRIEMETSDGNWRMELQWRFQFRFSTPFDATPAVDPVSALEGLDQATLRVRRARLKVGGHAYRPWLGYYLEYDFPSTTLLDWRMTVGPSAAQARIGQWKVNYSRERVSSSGEQQFVERSVVNYVFTYDRQVGVMLLGHLFAAPTRISATTSARSTVRGRTPRPTTTATRSGSAAWSGSHWARIPRWKPATSSGGVSRR